MSYTAITGFKVLTFFFFFAQHYFVGIWLMLIVTLNTDSSFTTHRVFKLHVVSMITISGSKAQALTRRSRSKKSKNMWRRMKRR